MKNPPKKCLDCIDYNYCNYNCEFQAMIENVGDCQFKINRVFSLSERWRNVIKSFINIPLII